MKRTIRILSLLLLMMVGAGQVWADTKTYGKIYYEYRPSDGGGLICYTSADDASAYNNKDFVRHVDTNNPYTCT